MTYLDGDRFLDGVRLAAWIETEFPDYRSIAGPTGARRVSCWRTGVRADVYSLDRVLIALGAHPSDVPDDCWECDQRRDRGAGVGTRWRTQGGQFARPVEAA